MVMRLWGRADLYELAFSPLDNEGEQWSAAVPADMEDGQYAVELYAEDDSGNVAYWTGMLYLNKSECVSVRIVADVFKVWMCADLETVMQDEPHIWMKDDITLKMACLNKVSWG